MVEEIKLIDKVYLQKYIYLMTLFVSKEINAPVFEELFLQIRREDTYWFSGLFHKDIGEILDSFFLDVDEYLPEELYDPLDTFNIDEEELMNKAKQTLIKLKEITSR